MNKHKRGDLSPCGTLRFWQYQSYISKKTGQKAERWIPVDAYENYRKDYNFRCELGAARSDYIKMQQQRTKQK